MAKILRSRFSSAQICAMLIGAALAFSTHLTVIAADETQTAKPAPSARQGDTSTAQPANTTASPSANEAATSQQPNTTTSTPGTTSMQPVQSASVNTDSQTKTSTDEPPPGFNDAIKLYSTKKYSQAATAFERFIQFGVANTDTHLYLGGCYQQLKKYDAALKEYDWVAKHAPLISAKRKAESLAHTLRCYRAGICPGSCLKLSNPGWQHYPGLDPSLLWMKFSFADGWSAWSTHHLGEVIVYENGKPVNKGKCPICGGTGEVPKLK